jgi:hypothetical protein
MRTIDDYCDKAIANNKFRSDRELSKALGFSGSDISNYRRKRVWPSDITMVKLANLAGIPADEALIELKVWQNNDTIAGEVYTKLLARIAHAACLAIILISTSSESKANQPVMSDSVYYGKKLLIKI